jgi:hypothetical protein
MVLRDSEIGSTEGKFEFSQLPLIPTSEEIPAIRKARLVQRNTLDVTVFSSTGHGLNRVIDLDLATAIVIKLAVTSCIPTVNATNEKSAV